MKKQQVTSNKLQEYWFNLVQPQGDSHKGQNGKLLVIGGSELFHASLIWSAEVASRVVDMVHVTSPAEVNNHLMRTRLKEHFWNGIVVPWERVEEYIAEDDCILIGPGMTRQEGLEQGEAATHEVVNHLLRRFPDKRWVIDGGALQEVDSGLLTGNMLITPHHKEWERISGQETGGRTQEEKKLKAFSQEHDGLTIILKGKTDMIVQGDEVVKVEGGNVGMTKGGTGDVLAGLAAALCTTNEILPAAVAASRVNKRAGELCADQVGRFYNASDLLQAIPRAMHELFNC